MTPDNSVKLRVGDIVRWEYIENKYTPDRYWCCSRIAEVFENADGELWLHDTYWEDRSSGRSFSVDEIGSKIEVEFIANMSDLVACRESEFAMYSKEDCVNLSYPNSRGLYYLRKGAKKDTGRMKRCLEAHIEHYQDKSEYYARLVKSLQEDLDNFDEENPDNNYIPCDKNVWWE